MSATLIESPVESPVVGQVPDEQPAAKRRTGALLVLGFESPAHETEPLMSLALECCADHGGSWGARSERASASSKGDAVDTWREAFLRAPYLRDTFVAMGVLSETFETAVTWDRFPRGPARSFSSGPRSSRPRPTPCSPAAALSPTTTPSGAITGPGMTASARTRSRPPCGAPRPPWIRPGRSIRVS